MSKYWQYWVCQKWTRYRATPTIPLPHCVIGCHQMSNMAENSAERKQFSVLRDLVQSSGDLFQRLSKLVILDSIKATGYCTPFEKLA